MELADTSVLSQPQPPSPAGVGTTCLSCVFATFEDGRQTGCRLGRVERLVGNGAVPEWEQEGGLHYLNLKGRLCLANRHKDSDWARSTPPDERADKVRAEMRVRLHAVVLVTGNDTLEDVIRTASSLEKQELPARLVHFVVNADNVKSGELIRSLRLAGPGLAWTVKVVTERLPTGARPSDGRCADMVVDSLKPQECGYYAVFHAGYEVPATFVSDIDTALNERLERFVMLRPAVYDREGPHGTVRFVEQGLVVQTRLHQMVGGNKEAVHDAPDGRVIHVDDVEEKIDMMVAEDKAEHLIKLVGDVCRLPA